MSFLPRGRRFCEDAPRDMRARKPTRTLMLVLCPTLVLCFLYYSAARLQLRIWGFKAHIDVDSSLYAGHVLSTVYDKQGFLRKLDGKLPLELQYKYGNLSKGECRPGFSEAKMTSIYPKFSKPAPMFLDLNFKRLSKINTYPPPFGIKTQEKIIKLILAHTKNYGLGSELDSLNCKRCIIIGNGGILSNKSLGSKIDEYDVVIRLNKAPISGFERDVGSKTTMRITYPEGAIQYPERYENHSLFVFSAFKPLDFKWLRQMVFKERLHHTEGFWKSVALVVPRDPEDMRILNPYFIQEAAFWFIGLPHNNGLMGHGVRELRKCPHPPRLDIHTHAHLNPAHDCFYSRGNICPYADPCSDPRTDLCIGLCAGPCADPYAYPLW